MKFKFFFLLFLLLLTVSCSSDYPNLGDVPDYKAPSISIQEAQKELGELKTERQKAKTLAAQVDART